jgi:RNA polymerase sigma-70 factor (ECF subfamily)
MIPGDEQLVERMARGDQSALGLLYERHAADVLRVCKSLLRNEAQAADLVQDVFLEAWRRADQYDELRGTVRAWLMVRTRSRALDRLRSQATKREVALSDTSRGKMGSTEPEVNQMHLPKAFERVSEEERAVLMLGYFEGLTCAEMSERLQIPVGTVKSRTRTAISKLRDFFEEGQE